MAPRTIQYSRDTLGKKAFQLMAPGRRVMKEGITFCSGLSAELDGAIGELASQAGLALIALESALDGRTEEYLDTDDEQTAAAVDSANKDS